MRELANIPQSLLLHCNHSEPSTVCALLQGVCGLWDADHTMQPLNPRALNLGEFAAEAAKHNAVVYLGALPGRLGEDGTVVQMLESEGVITTGELQALGLWDRGRAAQVMHVSKCNYY